jgi:SAM-dependent methyltransferase
MADSCTLDLRDQVRDAYTSAAETPAAKHPFPVGRQFAKNAGYPDDLLDSLPPVCYEAFCGASSVSVFARFPAGATVLDLGCGAGLDSLIAARTAGKVHGVDFSGEMLKRARSAASEVGAGNVEFHEASAENLPLPDDSVDAALVNGIFNLNPARDSIFGELERVVRDGGQVFAAEIVLREPPGPLKHAVRALARLQSDPTDWFA